MATALPLKSQPETPAIPIRRIDSSDLWIALRQGFDDFRERRGDIVFLGVIYPIVGIVSALVALQVDAAQFIFPLVAGLTLLGPAVAAIFYEVAKRRERGEDSSWNAAMGLFRSPSIDELVTLTALLAGIFAMWMLAAWAIYAWTLGPEPPQSMAQFARDLFGTAEGWTMIVVGNLVGFLFAATALAIGFVSFPMLVDRPVSASTALRTSLRAAMRNPVATATWGLIVAALLVLGSIPFFVGLAVVLPILGYATWHLYTRVVER
jgi:uncharacterized membrane protein